jgi:hypothetical protein
MANEDHFVPNRLVKRIRALPELAMQREVLVEQLSGMLPEDVFSFLQHVLSGVKRRQSTCMIILDAVHECVLSFQKHAQHYELLTQVYRLAREKNDELVSGLLLIAYPHKGPVERHEIAGDLTWSQLSLGERKSLARCHDKTKLDHLLRDPEPAVMKNLLRNPRLVESDVLRVASRRPINMEVLMEVYASKWSKRYRIQMALVSNPYTPTDLSLKLMGFLFYKDLKAVAADANLHRLVRQQAKHLLKGRRSGDRF